MNLKDLGDISGTYRISANSKKYLQDFSSFENESIIEISKSGNYEMRNIPSVLLQEVSLPIKKSTILKNRWNIACIENSNCVMELEFLGVRRLARHMSNNLAILFVLGDGDMCEGLVYEKE
ncbi:hypothetical protein [Leptospira venezuelensis]|uniref:hypothetical protein n=1 Tax=Leptospira venezuelensis TaxID=1958811 RepID=UPI0012FFAA2B|nr:hypothetical protein [Leptospira venezuelensis]